MDNLIGKIGTVTANSGPAINNAWNAYNALTAEQKALVKNFNTLQEATQKWNQLKADEVVKLIDKIEEPVTEKSKASIEAARKAYDGLTDAQKRLVTNTKKLTDAEKAYAQLTATPEDKEDAQKVIDLIKKLTNVTLDSEKDIQAARKAYDALTDLQKLLVDNYDILTTAETKLAMLKAMGKVSDPYISTGDYMEKLGTPGIGAVGGEWMVIGLARSERTVPGVEDYYKKVLEYVAENIDPETGRLHKAKSTDNSRIIIALTAIGKDVTNVGGYNLLAGLSDLEFVKYQGNNGPIWALLALDSGNYPVPSGGTVTRQALIDEILRVQTSDGGWTVYGDKADSDMTGMALTALAPYYTKDLKVQEAIDKAIARLSEMQDEDGGYSTSYDGTTKIATSESISQVVTALSALGINADTDPRFVKNGKKLFRIARFPIGHINVTGLGVVDDMLLHDFDFCHPLLFDFYICRERPIPRSSSCCPFLQSAAIQQAVFFQIDQRLGKLLQIEVLCPPCITGTLTLLKFSLNIDQQTAAGFGGGFHDPLLFRCMAPGPGDNGTERIRGIILPQGVHADKTLLVCSQ